MNMAKKISGQTLLALDWTAPDVTRREISRLVVDKDCWERQATGKLCFR
jgi:hypothetical protein